MTEYERFTEALATASREHPQWRYGQAVFNTLLGFRRDLADRLDGSRLDPFYDDRLVGACLGWVERGMELDAILAEIPPHFDDPGDHQWESFNLPSAATWEKWREAGIV